MRFSNLLVSLEIALLAGVEQVMAGPGGYVSLVNASPYDWVLVYKHEYQMDWQPRDVIPAGTAHLQYFEYWYHHGDTGDCAAEATYVMHGSPVKQKMTVQARQNGGGKRIEIQYLDSLSSLNNPENSLINLGYVHDGAVQFVLASNDGVSYVSSNPPVAWMQSTLPAIGSKTLRTLSMPASHDSGISELTYQWTGIPHNTQTQSVHVYKQLLYGARFFDIRPVLYYGNWYCGHFSQLSTDDWVGATGRTLDHIIDDINRFTSEHPGELIILDITHDASIDRWWARLNEDEWQNLYVKLSAINDLWVPENGNLPYDISTSPINSFIKPGSKSAVIIRIPASAPAPGSNTSKRGMQIAPRNRPDQGTLVDPNIYDTFNHEEIPVLDKENGYGVPNTTLSARELEPAHNLSTVTPRAASGPWQQAFISTNRFPLSGSYAETRWPAIMSANQLDKLSSQGSENDAPHMGFWTLTQYWTDITDFATPRHSIINMAKKAYRALFTDLWPAMRRENKWPNLIMADDIHNTEVAALCMAINSYFPHAPSEVQKRQLISPVQGNGTRSMDHNRCEVQTRERNEAELKHLVSEQQNALQSLQEYHESQAKTLDFDLVDEDTKTRRVMAQEFEDLHQRQKSETISVNSRLNKDKEMSAEEKKRIRDELIDAQAKERLRIANMHAQALQNMRMRGGDLGTELKARQAAETKAFLERQAKELEELKREQEEFLNQVLKYYFGDGRTPYCPKTRDDFPIPENTYKPARLSYSKKVLKPVYTSVYSSARRRSYVVVPTGAYHAAASPYALSKAYSTSGRYHAAPTGGYKYVPKPYYPIATGAYYVPSKQGYPTGAYYAPSKQSYPTGAYHIPSQQSYPSGAYNPSPRPGNAYNRPYYQVPSNQSVIQTNAYGSPKPYQTAPVNALYPNITTTTVTQAYGTNVLPPYPTTFCNTTVFPVATQTVTLVNGTTTLIQYSTLTTSGNATEPPLEPTTITVIGGTTTFTVFSTHTVYGTLPGFSMSTSFVPTGMPTTTPSPLLTPTPTSTSTPTPTYATAGGGRVGGWGVGGLVITWMLFWVMF